jgi:hypothetical protein
MAFGFNPFTGNFDLTGGGDAAPFAGQVDAYADLPLDSAAALNSRWLVKNNSGTWPFSTYKQAGIYIRVSTVGASRDTDYQFVGTLPSVMNDSEFLVYDDTDATKNLKFQLSGITTGTTRTLTAPDASGRIQVEGQPIGNVTAAAGSFTTLSASDALTASNATASPPTTLTATKGLQWLLPSSGYAAIAGIYPGSPAISLLTGSPGGMSEHARFSLSGITFNRALTINNGTLTASAPVLDLAQTWNASGTTFTALNLALTNTASASASSCFNINLDADQVFSIRRGESTTGATLITCGRPGLTWTARTRTGAGVGVNFSGNIGVGGNLQFGTGTSTTAGDITISREAANILAQSNGLNAQTFNIYNTFTSATNHERGFLRWSSNVFQIGTEKGSGSPGGTARPLEFQTDGVTRMTIAANGNTTIGGGLPLGWGGGGTRIIGATFPAALLQFQTGSTDRLTIDANGIIGIGGTTASFPALKRDSTVLQVRLADDSAFAGFSCGALTLNGNLDASTRDIVTDTTTGTKIGTATTQKIGFFNATPVVQQAAVADATNGASTQDRLNDLLARLRTLGLIAT